MRAPLAHRMSRRNFLGQGLPDSGYVDAYSAELRVTRDTPPTFIAHARDDDIVSTQHGELFCNASRAHGARHVAALPAAAWLAATGAP